MPSKFDTFAALHVPGNPVILFNIWDVGSAQAAVRAGAKALATGSHPVADAHGWPDGEQVPIDFALANAERIARAVEVPLTVDFESAYSLDPAKAASNVARLAATGATMREIAGALHISPRTVESHLGHVYLKLGVASKHELRRRGEELRLREPPQP